MSETCKVCGRPSIGPRCGGAGPGVMWCSLAVGHGGEHEAWDISDSCHTLGVDDCYRLGYTRELAAREAAERAKEHAELSLKTEREWHIAALDRAKVAEDDRDYFKASYSRKIDDERRALEAAQNAIAQRDAERVANAGLRALVQKVVAAYDGSGKPVFLDEWFTEARAALSAAPPLPMGALRAASVEEKRADVFAGYSPPLTGAVAFLRSVIRCGEKLSAEDDAMLDKMVAEAHAAAVPPAAAPQDDPDACKYCEGTGKEGAEESCSWCGGSGESYVPAAPQEQQGAAAHGLTPEEVSVFLARLEALNTEPDKAVINGKEYTRVIQLLPSHVGWLVDLARHGLGLPAPAAAPAPIDREAAFRREAHERARAAHNPKVKKSDARPRCAAKTRKGNPCIDAANGAAGLCASHAASKWNQYDYLTASEQPRAAAPEQLSEKEKGK